jgi:anthranilate phosphoribosyltransferase
MAFEQPLSAERMQEVFGAIMASRLPEADIRDFLTTLARRGETAEEIASAVGVLRAHAVALPLSRPEGLCDTCGTGGDGQGTINISTLAALVAASAGVRVVKHGNRAASSRCGSADLLEALGVHLDASPAQVARSVETLGFGFCFAPKFHPAMKAVAPIRKSLGIRTIFNLIGPLANPAPLAFQLVGVAEERLLRPMAEALVRLKIRHGMVVRGRDGLDEVTTTGPTETIEVKDGRLTTLQLTPERFGIARASLEALRGGDAERNAAIAREVLANTPSAARDVVVLNAGCAIAVAEQAKTLEEGVAKADAALASGQAAKLLERVKEFSAHAG